MDKKVLVKVLVPEIDESYDIFIPINMRIGTLLALIGQSIKDITSGVYPYKEDRDLYNPIDSKPYPMNSFVRDTNIRNGTTLIYM